MIPLARPTITKEEKEAVLKVLDSGILSLGPNLERFAESFAGFIGTKFAVPINSGTSGLHLVVKSLGIKDGDEVITTPFSFIASSNCILYEKAKPVFVDIDEENFNMNPDLIKEKITKKTKAILVVHVFGQSCDMEKINSVAKRHKLVVIEDACESIGATYKGKKVGTFGEAAVFAFYPNKQITTGEGGLITTNNEKIFKLCSSLANQGRGENLDWLTHDKLGYNYRMDEMSAALGLAQLNKIGFLLKERKTLAGRYLQELSDLKGVELPKVSSFNTHSWLVFAIRVKNKKIRDYVIGYLKRNGVQTKAYFYPPIHLQLLYRREFGYQKGDFPTTEKISDTILILPFFVGMSESEIIEVKNKLKRALENV